MWSQWDNYLLKTLEPLSNFNKSFNKVILCFSSCVCHRAENTSHLDGFMNFHVWKFCDIWVFLIGIFTTYKSSSQSEEKIKTRMHSSRMRTVCSSGHIWGGGSARGGVCLQGVCSWVVSALGGVCLWGVSASGGVSALGGVCCRGVSAPRGCLLRGVYVVSQHALRQTPPPCGQTHTCKNITFPASLRTVKRHPDVQSILGTLAASKRSHGKVMFSVPSEQMIRIQPV